MQIIFQCKFSINFDFLIQIQIILTKKMIGQRKWSKMKQWEMNKNYKAHMQKMREISSPLKRKINKQQIKKDVSGPDFSYFKSCHKIQQQRLMDIQNNRLLKKLSEIGKRKNKFAHKLKDQQNYYTINMRSRQANRKIKFQEIQEENDLIVQRILKKRNGKSSLHDISFQSVSKKSLNKSRKKNRNVSLILPRIQTSIENVEQA